MPTTPPFVLCLSGHDPTGGAGIQADAEAIAANGAWPLTLVTALTAQNTCRLKWVTATPADLLLTQTRLLLEEFRPAAIKIGLLPNAAVADACAEILDQCGGIPLVLDPVLASSSGARTADPATQVALLRLLPQATLLTPNQQEARTLAGARDTDPLAEVAAKLHRYGAAQILITGTDASEADKINHTLFSKNGVEEFGCLRLPGNYHGSGCTLAAAIAAGLAHQQPITEAIELALDYTWHSLKHSRLVGKQQALPNRWFHLPTDD